MGGRHLVKNVWFAGLALCACLALVGCAASPGRGAAGPAPTMTVPSVVGLDRGQAEAALTVAGLVLGGVTEAYDASVTVGSVTAQTPASGADVARGSAVDLIISRGPESVAVPNVIGKAKAEAATVLEAAGFKVKSQNKDDRAKKGNVIGQSPISGKLAKPGATIAITVSTGVSMARLTADLARATRVKYEALHGVKIVSGVAGLYKDSKGVYWGKAWFEAASGSDRGWTIWRYTGGSWHEYAGNNASETGVSKWEPGLPSAVQHAIGTL